VRVKRAGANAAALEPATGVVRVTILDEAHFTVGDEVRVSSRIRFPRNDGDQGEFDYRGWLLRNRITATMFADYAKSGAPLQSWSSAIAIPGALAHRSGARAYRRLHRCESLISAKPEMRALIIGDRSGIDESIRQRFALTGMAHVLVISGLHLGFVAAAAFSSCVG